MKRPKILIVDDERFFINTILEHLKDDYDTSIALNGEQALDRARHENAPDLILLDIVMPEMDGYAVCARLKASPLTRDIPIIFLTIRSDLEDELKGFQLGAVDYISKPISSAILRARIKTHLSLRKAQVEMQNYNQRLEEIVAERTHALREEIAERKSLESRLSYMANYDPLTKLPNRALFLDRLNMAIKTAVRQKTKLSLILIDLNGFKLINDTLGHQKGDRLLCHVADNISQCTRDVDMLSRLGGDEFALILNDTPDKEAVIHTVEKLMTNISVPVDIENIENVTACIGISRFPEDANTAEELLCNADIAVYEAKRIGKANYVFFYPSLNHDLMNRMNTEKALKQALRKHQFSLHYQPIFDARSGELYGAEALIRWQHPKDGMIYPDHFIPIAEESELIIDVGTWVLKEAIHKAAEWNRLPQVNSLCIAVNVSTRQFIDAEACISLIGGLLKDTQLEPELLSLEITESLMVDNTSSNIENLQRLKDLGVSLSIDDFGTGYSSLSYIRQFPIDKLKIDRSFIHDMAQDSDDAALVNAIVSMARSLQLKTVAEGVESPEQKTFLEAIGCNLLQGYLFSRPLPEDEFVEKYLTPARQ